MSARSTRHLLVPTVAAGALMALYLLVRPYGDAGSAAESAEAFASTAWLIAHLNGALAIAAIGWLALRLADLFPSRAARVARTTGLAGAVLVLPYYGAETYGLHAIGDRALTDPAVLDLAEQVRNQPIALTTFAVGLVLLAVAGIAFALAWSRELSGASAKLGWPLGILIALLAPQFYLPPAGRVGYGLAFLAAAIMVAVVAAKYPGPAAEVSAVPRPSSRERSVRG